MRIRKKAGFAIMVMLALILFEMHMASGSGLFPAMDEMFGTSMQSVRLATGRDANETIQAEEGERKLFAHFGMEDYQAFGQYLGGVGATLKSYTNEDGIFSAAISVAGAEMNFKYDWKEGKAEVFYPSGTREETEKTQVSGNSSIFPPVGGIMPSAQFAIERKPDQQKESDAGIRQEYTKFDDDAYNAFGEYLGQTGAKLEHYDLGKGTLSASIGLGGFSFSIDYNWKTKEMAVVYPAGTIPETEKWNTLKESKSILPELSLIGKELPSISQAIEREPDKIENLADGSTREVYHYFEDNEYNAFSQYLQKTGCQVDEYHTEGDTIVITLSNATDQFVFSYDGLRHEGSILYPTKARIEAAWKPTPTPAPVPTPETRKASSYEYSEDECYSAAENYLQSVLKNPSSLQIHSHRTIYYDDTYCFVIDFSAQNGFGGYTRSDAYIWITKSNKSVYFADID